MREIVHDECQSGFQSTWGPYRQRRRAARDPIPPETLHEPKLLLAYSAASGVRIMQHPPPTPGSVPCFPRAYAIQVSSAKRNSKSAPSTCVSTEKAAGNYRSSLGP